MSASKKLLVAAIDFGTTYSGYAFSFKHEYDNDPTKVTSNNWTAGSRGLISFKTPTTVLLDQKKKFHSFGYAAEDKYSELAEDDQHHGWYYFRRFKMMLFQNIVSFKILSQLIISLMFWLSPENLDKEPHWLLD